MSFKILETHVLAGTTALRGSHNHEGKPSHAQMGYRFCRPRPGRRTTRLHRASGRFRVHRQDPALCLPRALRRLADLRPRLSGGLAAWRQVLPAEKKTCAVFPGGLRRSPPCIDRAGPGSPSIGTCEDREVGLGSSLAMTLGKEPLLMNGNTTKSPGLDPATPPHPSDPTVFAVGIALAMSLVLVFLTRLPVARPWAMGPAGFGFLDRIRVIGF